MLSWVRIRQQLLAALAASMVAVPPGCSDRRPGSFAPEMSDAGSEDATLDVQPSGCEGPPALDSTGYCGNEIVPVLTRKPNLYFVVDASRSMAEGFLGSSVDKYTHALLAVRDLLREVGHRINYGAALFPEPVEDDTCAPGAEVFETAEGDALDCERLYGPVLSDFFGAVGDREPSGATPLAETLEALTANLESLEGSTSVILITDGAPNCHDGLGCPADECVPNLERVDWGGGVCGIDIDCCDASIDPLLALNCLDSARSLDAIEALEEEGIRTYVVGLPGSEVFGGVLDAMAAAGGTSREGETEYFSVTETDDLEKALDEIGGEGSLGCSIELSEPPTNPERINVYFDDELVQGDSDDGWSYAEDAIIELHGDACDVLEGGTISQVQVVEGCPTLVK